MYICIAIGGQKPVAPNKMEYNIITFIDGKQIKTEMPIQFTSKMNGMPGFVAVIQDADKKENFGITVVMADTIKSILFVSF